MKKNISFLFLLLFGVGACGQQAYKGQFGVTNKELSVSGDTLHVGMSVSYERLQLPSDESVTLTPVLKGGSGESCEFPPVQISGRLKQKSYHRREVLGSVKKSARSASSPGMVVTDHRKGTRQFVYNARTPYESWMKDATLVLRTRECGCNGKPAGVYEDKIGGGVSLPPVRVSSIGPNIDPRYLSLANIVPLVDGEDTLHTLKGTIPFWGSKGLDKLSDSKQEYEIYFRVREAVRLLEQQNGTTVTGLKITGYGTPRGNYRKNEKACSKQALALKDYLRENYVAGKVPLEVSWVAEDWDSIRSLVRTSDMPLRDAVMDIINTVELTRGRERMLMDLADGNPYRYLEGRIFPRVRRVEYFIRYTQYRLDTAEGRRLFEMGSRSLKLSEFFAVALSYPKGSNEYNDAFDLAARLFPDSPEASINAAAVALSKRDARKARAYLSKYETLPLAYNNMGILHLLEGNRDKAEVYLQMAAANGVKEAKQALESLRNNK